MPEFLDRILGRAPEKKSSTVAKERLQFILVHDRINLPPERMEAMKREILEVIAKYVSVDNENVEIALQKRERSSLLVAEIPFLKTLEAAEFEDPDDKPSRNHMMSADDDEDDDAPSVKQDDVPQFVDEAPSVDEMLTVDENLSLDEPPADEPPTPPPANKTKSTSVPKRKR